MSIQGAPSLDLKPKTKTEDRTSKTVTSSGNAIDFHFKLA